MVRCRRRPIVQGLIVRCKGQLEGIRFVLSQSVLRSRWSRKQASQVGDQGPQRLALKGRDTDRAVPLTKDKAFVR